MDTFELTMAHDFCVRVIGFQGAEQGDESCTLGWRAGVFRTPFLIQASFIADTDGVGVVMPGMHTDFFLVTGLIELAVALDVVVIADTFVVEAGIVAGAKHVDREALVAAGRRTMNNNKGYCTHD